MSQAPVVFNFVSNTLRVVMRDGNPWFVAADVCAALGIGNTTDALRRLDDDEQALDSIEGISRGNDQANIINESGLYSLILGSRKPEAKKFKKWVTSEVLPAIRKTGSYHAVPPAPTSDAAHEVLNAKDMGNLTRMVWLICHEMPGEQAWRHAVWHRLRQVTGTAAPNRFEVRHLPLIASEVRRMARLSESFRDAERTASQMLIRRVLRNGAAEGPILAQSRQLMMDAVTRDDTELNRLLAYWHEADIARLEQRKESLHHGGYIAAYAEPGGAPF